MSRPFRLMLLNPCHFHAALVLKEMPPEVYPRAYVYGPLDADMVEQLGRIAAFNDRADNPTHWQLDIRAGHDFLSRFLREQPGNATIIAGRNRNKIENILHAVTSAGHVLADKPWVIDTAGFRQLAEVFHQADLREVLAWDLMTERFDIATILQRELMQDDAVFGGSITGTLDEPALVLDATHYLKKSVAGRALQRPTWWFDPAEAGTGLADVGTHLADLAIWLLFPDQALDHRADLEMLEARIWPTPIRREQFRDITGLAEIPPDLRSADDSELLLYPGNGTVAFHLRGRAVRFTVHWDVESPPGTSGDIHDATAVGHLSRIRVQTRANASGQQVAELTILASEPADRPELFAAALRHCGDWQLRYPGVTAEDAGREIRIRIPDRYRTDHEQHFADVLDEFLRHARNPRRAPAWEIPNLLTKYAITTQAVELALGKQ